jgi:phospholipid/cholesterol/gamma-HCH transport system substrate-binding protein
LFVDRHQPPYETAGAVFLVLVALAAALMYSQIRGDLAPKTQLTLLTSRAGLVVDPGSKGTYNGGEIGRVTTIGVVDVDGTPEARSTGSAPSPHPYFKDNA